MTTITSQKICRHLNFIEFHKRLTPNKTTFQKITGHLPPIVGRWINSALGNKLKKNISTQMSCFFSPVRFALIFFVFFLVNSWPTYFLKVNNSWWNHMRLQWWNALTNHQGLPFFCPKGLKKLPFSCWPKSRVSIWQAWHFWGMQDLVGEHLGNNGCDIVVKNNSQKWRSISQLETKRPRMVETTKQ